MDEYKRKRILSDKNAFGTMGGLKMKRTDIENYLIAAACGIFLGAMLALAI